MDMSEMDNKSIECVTETVFRQGSNDDEWQIVNETTDETNSALDHEKHQDNEETTVAEEDLDDDYEDAGADLQDSNHSPKKTGFTDSHVAQASQALNVTHPNWLTPTTSGSNCASSDEKTYIVSQRSTICSACQNEIAGTRYRCFWCKDFNLCSQCENQNIVSKPLHDPLHAFVKILNPEQCVDHGLVATATKKERNILLTQNVGLPLTASVRPNEYIFAGWKLRNNGNEQWPDGYHLRWDGDERKNPFKTARDLSKNRVTVPAALPGQEVDVFLELYAPSETGNYTGSWRIYDQENKPAGPVLKVQVQVTSPLSTAVMSPTTHAPASASASASKNNNNNNNRPKRPTHIPHPSPSTSKASSSSLSTSSSSSSSSNSNTIPRGSSRSSYAAAVQRSANFTEELNQLSAMGFTDEATIKKHLQAGKSVSQIVELLTGDT